MLTINIFNCKYLEICPEPNPKWGGLTEILKEIGQTSKDNRNVVLILVKSAKTCCQLKNVIQFVYQYNVYNNNLVYS